MKEDLFISENKKTDDKKDSTEKDVRLEKKNLTLSRSNTLH